ncbi:RidA family protein [Mesorhizobium sp. CO1-1-8]|uniref:RidA family protein n=1 Tax=Mesorhizobium sp. CO1-1-8 TaxID=2876631 RepID=UPI001CD16781|nr:RidA family protein [Mesorhizobium sp. CO1-1-8]MBZ9776076.1 RidA family protein [Mesorhizobium sp. CO1-1-8]
MELVTHRKFKNGRLMPWGKGRVVTGAKGFVLPLRKYGNRRKLRSCRKERRGLHWRCGGTVARNSGEHQIRSGRTRQCVDYLIRLTFFIQGPFPDGGVLSSPNFRLDVLDEFFAEHCPKHCSYNNPPPSEVIGVAALAQADIVVEIVAVAALPD